MSHSFIKEQICLFLEGLIFRDLLEVFIVKSVPVALAKRVRNIMAARVTPSDMLRQGKKPISGDLVVHIIRLLLERPQVETRWILHKSSILSATEIEALYVEDKNVRQIAELNICSRLRLSAALFAFVLVVRVKPLCLEICFETVFDSGVNLELECLQWLVRDRVVVAGRLAAPNGIADNSHEEPVNAGRIAVKVLLADGAE